MPRDLLALLCLVGLALTFVAFAAWGAWWGSLVATATGVLGLVYFELVRRSPARR
jgi:hypothetical protein